jgi:hypothetical protein
MSGTMLNDRLFFFYSYISFTHAHAQSIGSQKAYICAQICISDMHAELSLQLQAGVPVYTYTISLVLFSCIGFMPREKQWIVA